MTFVLKKDAAFAVHRYKKSLKDYPQALKDLRGLIEGEKAVIDQSENIKILIFNIFFSFFVKNDIIKVKIILFIRQKGFEYEEIEFAAIGEKKAPEEKIKAKEEL